jgi:hypothetical protein
MQRARQGGRYNLKMSKSSIAANRVTIALAQINCVVGDLAGNSAKILEFALRAREAFC